MLNFVESARSDYEEKEGEIEREDARLVEESALVELNKRALRAIRSLTDNEAILDNPDALYVLFMWSAFTNKSGEPRHWTARLLENDVSVAKLAGIFTGESWSIGMGGISGGLSDRVSMMKKRARLDGAERIIDVEAFKLALRRAAKSSAIREEQSAAVKTLIDLIEKPERD